MNRNEIDLEFADGEYVFGLPAPRIEELQRKTGIGIGGLFARLLKGVVKDPITKITYVNPALADFYYADIVDTLRQGLIGGGRGTVNGSPVTVTPLLAEQLIRGYVLDRPLADSWSLAVSVLGACVSGYDPPKKGEPVQETGSAPPKKSARKKKAGSITASS